MRPIGLTFSCLAFAVAACSGESTTPIGTGGTVAAQGGGTAPGTTSPLGTGGAVVGAGGAVVGAGGAVVGAGGAVVGAGGAVVGAGGAVVGAGGAGGSTAASGGKTSSGGSTTAAGGKTSSGGATTAAGGKTGSGGATTAAGGKTSSGGATTAAGGATAAAGGSSSVGACSRPVGACTAPTVTVTNVALGSAVTTFNEGDTSVFPSMIAAIPSGGSRLAWLGTDKNVRIAQLGCDDKMVGTPFTVPAVDLQDIIADDNGGVVLVTRDATNGGTDNCGTGTLCGGSSSPCRTMWMVRFNNAGTVEWETQVTNLSSTLAGYQNGARFIWWYQHHGRLAFSGSNYAAFFGVAITVNNGSCVDIHEGDRIQIVSSAGALVASGSLAVGMSHAWTSRILWDDRTNKFVSTDATDNNCRIVTLNPTVTIAASTCDGSLFNGDVVKSTTAGYWNVWSQGTSARLEHFTTGASDKTITAVAATQHPHLASYGASNMLLTWQSGTGTAAQVRSAGDGTTVGAQFSIAVSDHDFGAWKSYSDGSVAYVAASGTSANIARVMPCQ